MFRVSSWIKPFRFLSRTHVKFYFRGVRGGPLLSWEERWHPLREEWVVVAAHRQDRPWGGETVAREEERPPAYDPACHLCPGNRRVGGALNPRYEQTFVFDNDHPCVGPRAPKSLRAPHAPYRVRPAEGVARVVCYSPRHNLTLAELESQEIEHL